MGRLSSIERTKRFRDKKAPGEMAKYQREWRAKNKDKTKKHNQSQKLNGNHAKYWKGDAGKATSKRGYDKKMKNPGTRVMLSIGARITQSMADPSNRTSTRLKEFTEFKTSADVRDHFESLFEDWMNWDNYGMHIRDGPRNWNVGHRIPLSKFDPNDKVDFRRCWAKSNLFPQEARENHELNDSMPPKSILDPLRHIWPLGWKDCLPTV